MFLTSITLKNVRSISELRLDFRSGDGVRPWTYLLGENGCGKSTVLKAVGLVMAGANASFELLGDQDDWIRLGFDRATIDVEYQTAEGRLRTAGYEFVRDTNTREFMVRNSDAMDKLSRAIEKSERNYFVVGYGVNRYGGPRDEHSSIGRGHRTKNPRVGAVSSLFNLDTELVSLETWAMDLDYRKGDAALGAVRKALDNLLPNVSFSRIDRDKRQLLFNTVDGELPLSALSDGYQAIAIWCGDLLFQITETFKDYSDPLLARGLLLIDEVDLHLHPIWQRELVSFIKKTLPNIQVMVTTHSPLTVHQADEGELFVVTRTGDGSTLIPYAGAPNRLMLHQLIQSPLFGLETMDSPVVEKLREELRELQGIGKKSATSSAANAGRIDQIRAMLADTPSWSESRPGQERTNAALEKLIGILDEGKIVSGSDFPSTNLAKVGHKDSDHEDGSGELSSSDE